MGVNVPDSCSNCPTYEEIMLIFPDNSNPEISGKFEDGKRQGHHYNHYKWYKWQDPDKQYFWVDPPADMFSRITMITIQPVVQYKIPESINMAMNDTKVTFGHQRYVNDECTEAVIQSDIWITALGDTINYMKNGCDEKYTNLQTNYTKWYNSTMPLEKDLHKYYKFQKWLEQAKEDCIEKC